MRGTDTRASRPPPPESPRATRRAVLGRLAAGAGVLAAGGGVAALSAAPAGADDRAILTFALEIERAQEALYRGAADAGALPADLLAYARTAAAHEAAHVAALEEALGGAAPAPGGYEVGDAATDRAAFVRAATTLEELAIDAHNGQLANLRGRRLATLAAIVSVDARHAAWIRALDGRVPAADPVDAGRPAARVRADLADAGYAGGGRP